MRLLRNAMAFAALVALTLSGQADERPNARTFDTRDPQRLLALGRANDAIGALQQRLTQNPQDSQAWHLLSRTYLAEEQWDRSIDAGEKAVALNPNSSDFHMWLGRAYGEKADHISKVNFIAAIRTARKVHSEFERAVALDANNFAAQSDLAEFQIDAPGYLGGGLDKAQLTQGKLAGHDAATGHWLQARINEKKGDMSGAEKEYRAATESAGDTAPYWMNLASFFRRRNKLDDMEAAIQKAVGLTNHRDGVLMEGAAMLVRTNRNFNAAGQWLRQYLSAAEPIEMDPTFQAHFLLGSIAEKQGDRSAAAAEYRNALQLASAYEPAQQALKRVQQ